MVAPSHINSYFNKSLCCQPLEKNISKPKDATIFHLSLTKAQTETLKIVFVKNMVSRNPQYQLSRRNCKEKISY